MQEKLENNRRMQNNGTLRAGSNYMQAVDGNLTIFCGQTLAHTHHEHVVLISKNHQLISLQFFVTSESVSDKS